MTTHVRMRLLSTDTAQERAAKIMHVAGLTVGDPLVIAETMHWVERCIREYAAADREARSWCTQ